MKKILFTEKQIKSILGEEAFMYLDQEDNGLDFPEDSLVATGGEVLTNDPDADEFPTTDKIAASKTRSHPFYRNAGYGTMFEGKKKIEEINHKLVGRKYRLGKKTNQQIDNIAANNPGDKMLNNMSKEKNASANCLAVRQTRLKQMKQNNPERYERIGGDNLENAIDDRLGIARAEVNTASPEIQDPLMNTVQTARTGTGKGHRKDNGTTIYYENN
jgi:hypothetical protein